MRPLNVSNEVKRQYDRPDDRTRNTSTFDWFTRRLRMSTSGLTVTRELGSSRSVARHGTTALADEPGRFGPITAAAATPTVARPAPTRSREGKVAPVFVDSH